MKTISETVKGYQQMEIYKNSFPKQNNKTAQNLYWVE